MRYSPEHKEALRQRLIERARALSKRGGFEVTSIDTLMHSVGLSGAAFYRHFASKQELFSTVVEEEMSQSLKMLGGLVHGSDEAFAACLRGYLSLSHATHPEEGCAIPALGAEISRAAARDRSAVEKALLQLQRRWSERLHDDSDAAWSALSQCVGALLLARIVERDDLRREILAAVRRSTGRQFGLSLSRAGLGTLRQDQHGTKKSGDTA
jgi:TetR/AcrR family transcriptional repressor of nem operon